MGIRFLTTVFLLSRLPLSSKDSPVGLLQSRVILLFFLFAPLFATYPYSVLSTSPMYVLSLICVVNATWFPDF